MNEKTVRELLIAALGVLYAEGALAGAAKTAMLDVKNMDCDLCSVTVRKSLERVPGVAEAKVHFAHKTAVVKFDPDRTTITALTKATTDAGFPSTLHK